MKKKWGILLVLILVIGIAGALWTSMRAQKPIPVQGNLSPQEVAEIQRVIKHDLRRTIFPTLSWASFKELPGRIKAYLGYEMLEIDAPKDSSLAFVHVRLNPPGVNQNHSSFYTLTKASGRWEFAGFTMTYPSSTVAPARATVWTPPNPQKNTGLPPSTNEARLPLSLSPDQSLTGLLLGPEKGAPATQRRSVTRTYVRGVTIVPATNTTNDGAP